MSAPKRALLLNGSPRGRRSGSESLGSYLLARLVERGVDAERFRIGANLPSEQTLSEMLSAVERADLVILAAPLYVDSQPAPVVRAMEYLAEHRRGSSRQNAPQLVVIVNCGLPETFNNDVALRIYRKFASEAGLRWSGGMALGMGEALAQQPLRRVGRLARKVCRALDRAAAELAKGNDIPDEAVALMAKSLMPHWLYTWIAHRSWTRQAKKHGATTPLDARPLEQ